MAIGDPIQKKISQRVKAGPAGRGAKKTMPVKLKARGSAPKVAKPKSEAAKQLSVLTKKPTAIAARKAALANKVQSMKAVRGRAAAASVPTGRGASGAAAGKKTPGTTTRGQSNFVLDALRNAANSMTGNRERLQNERYKKVMTSKKAASKAAKKGY